VAAWVRLRANDKYSNVLAPDGTQQASFQLGVDPNGGWAFKMPLADDVNGGAPRKVAHTGVAAPLNTWTHLIGVYDASAKGLRLYVNGQRAAVADGLTAWDAIGGLQIGRSKYDGVYTNYWPGDVDDIKIFQQAVSDSEASELAQNTTPAGTTLQAHWKLDEVAGSKRVYGQTSDIKATVQGGATLGTDGQVGTAMRGDGSSG
jgi:hypothetical protein